MSQHHVGVWTRTLTYKKQMCILVFMWVMNNWSGCCLRFKLCYLSVDLFSLAWLPCLGSVREDTLIPDATWCGRVSWYWGEKEGPFLWGEGDRELGGGSGTLSLTGKRGRGCDQMEINNSMKKCTSFGFWRLSVQVCLWPFSPWSSLPSPPLQAMLFSFPITFSFETKF